MRIEDVLDRDLVQAADELRTGAISPVELLAAALERIEAADPALHAFITVAREPAARAARAAEREIREGNYRGPLHGVPVALKDVIDTAGMRTTRGSRIFADFIPEHDADVVRKLKNAGAIIVGKNNMHELAMGSTTANPYYGACRNPWNLAHVPGGSSGGSGAAVAAGLCFGAVATDTAGSIRSPASQCGVVGLKPTAGLVSTRGVFPVSPTLDHVGPIARTTRDVGVMLTAMAGGALPHAATRVDLTGVTVGVPRWYFFDGVAGEVETTVRKAISALANLGATISEVTWPEARETAEAALLVSAYEAYETHARRLREDEKGYSAELRERLLRGAGIARAAYESARADFRRLRERFAAAMEGIDVLCAPANPVPAPKHGEHMMAIGSETLPIGSLMPRFGAPANLLGCPALSLPCGFSSAGLPIGLQLIGRSHRDAELLAVAAVYEAAAGWPTLAKADRVSARLSSPPR